MILKFTLSSVLFIGIAISIFKITTSALCNDSALYSMNRISLRHTLNKENYLSKFNNTLERINFKCHYFIEGKKNLNLKRLKKTNVSFALDLKTSITNE